MNNETFEKNILLLSRKNSKLAATIRRIDAPHHIKVFSAANGSPTAEIKISPDISRLLHSAFDPEEEASDWADGLYKSADTMILLGLGLGYPAVSLVNSGFSGKLIIVERDISVFKLALMYCDLQNIISSSDTFIFAGKGADLLFHFLSENKSDNFHYAKYAPSVSLHRLFYEKVALQLDKTIYEKRKLLDGHLAGEMEKMLQLMRD